jgi:hypothetical protein
MGGGRILVEMPGPFGRTAALLAGTLASGARSRRPSSSARAKFSSLTWPESASTVRSFGRIPAAASWSPAPIERRVEQSPVDRVLGQHRADDDLMCGDGELAVVAGDIALLVAHHPYVRAGDVRPRVRPGPVGARWLIGGMVSAAFPGRRGRLPGLLLGTLRVPARLVLGGQPILGPSAASPTASAAAASARIFSICGSVRFAFCAASPASLVPSRRLAGIHDRYGPGHQVSRSIRRATPMILRTVEQVHDRAA